MPIGKLLKLELNKKYEKPSTSYHFIETKEGELKEMSTESCRLCVATASVGAQLVRGCSLGEWKFMLLSQVAQPPSLLTWPLCLLAQ